MKTMLYGLCLIMASIACCLMCFYGFGELGFALELVTLLFAVAGVTIATIGFFKSANDTNNK